MRNLHASFLLTVVSQKNGICPRTAALGIYDFSADIVGAKITEFDLPAGKILSPDHAVGTGKIPQNNLTDRGTLDANMPILNLKIIDLRTAGSVEFAVLKGAEDGGNVLSCLDLYKAEAVFL